MRKLPLGVAISMIVHAGVLAWVTTRGRVRAPVEAAERPKPTTIEIVAPAPVEPPAMEVALLDETAITEAPATAAPPQRPPPPKPPATAAAITTTAPSSPAGEPAGPGRGSDAAGPTAPAPSHSLLAMRGTGAPRAELPGLTPGQFDAYDHAPRGTAPEKEIHTGILQDDGATKKSNQGVFVAKVEADGTVKLTDSANVNVHLALPSARGIATGLQSWYYSDKDPGRGGEREGDGTSVNAPLARALQLSPGATTDTTDDSLKPKDREVTAIVPVLAGGFDVTDAMMRRHGVDPYASKKLKFLDATRDERVQVGNKHRAEQLAQVPVIMQQNLHALWAGRLDLAARKRALFELWDECAETGDPAVVTAAQAARRLVIGFIRGHLPAGSADAFTAAEVAALARTQQSKAVFEPYEP
jgi:hypothetical protein